MSRCLRKIQLLFLQFAVCVERRSLPQKPWAEGPRGRKFCLQVLPAASWSGSAKVTPSILYLYWKNNLHEELFLYGVKSGFNLSVLCPPYVIFEFLFFWWLCWRSLVYFQSWKDPFLLGWAACKQGLAHAYRCAKKKYRGRSSSLFVPGWRKMWMTCFSSIIPRFPPWCVISPQIQFRTLLRGLLRPGCRVRGSLGMEHPFWPLWWAWGMLRSWNKYLKMFSRSESCISGCLIWEHNKNLPGLPWWEWLLWDLESQWQGKGTALHPLGWSLTTALSFFVHLELNLLGKIKCSGNFITRYIILFCFVFLLSQSHSNV